ncbi:S8 family serine peptidase [Streptomyces sp. H27-S2]|uniref:S8 family serine peptidase n=1 Tax=Streptomyces antarcticus TaxID=2996458 RepID=UPI003B63FAEA
MHADLESMRQRVPVLDTGIDTTHREFEGRATWLGNVTGDGNKRDCNGRGTHLSGTVGAESHGVAKKTSLRAVKVADCDGTATPEDLRDSLPGRGRAQPEARSGTPRTFSAEPIRSRDRKCAPRTEDRPFAEFSALGRALTGNDAPSTPVAAGVGFSYSEGGCRSRCLAGTTRREGLHGRGSRPSGWRLWCGRRSAG